MIIMAAVPVLVPLPVDGSGCKYECLRSVCIRRRTDGVSGAFINTDLV